LLNNPMAEIEVALPPRSVGRGQQRRVANAHVLRRFPRRPEPAALKLAPRTAVLVHFSVLGFLA
jgi:hypothetical protein